MYVLNFNPSSGNPTKWSDTLKHFVGNSSKLSVFEHFVGLALKGLILLLINCLITFQKKKKIFLSEEI